IETDTSVTPNDANKRPIVVGDAPSRLLKSGRTGIAMAYATMSVNVAKATKATATPRERLRDMPDKTRTELAALLQVEAPERWDGQPDRLLEAVGGDRFAGGAAAVADIASAVQTGVAVEDFGVPAGLRDADSILQARNRREIEDHHDEIADVARVSDDRDDAVLVVVAVDPAEGVRIEITLVQ